MSKKYYVRGVECGASLGKDFVSQQKEHLAKKTVFCQQWHLSPSSMEGLNLT